MWTPNFYVETDSSDTQTSLEMKDTTATKQARLINSDGKITA